MNKKKSSPSGVSEPISQVASLPTSGPEVSPKILRALAADDYDEAIRWLAKEGNAPWSLNARAVCLLRSSRADQALQVYRTFVLSSGGIFLRPDVPTVYKTNYALTLLILGIPSGCLAALSEIEVDNERARQMRECIRAWEKTLPLWPWFNWKFGRVDPRGYPIAIDFPAGDFDFTIPPL